MTDDSKKEFCADFVYWYRREPAGDERTWHWCQSWDGLPIDSTCEEFEFCDCDWGTDEN